MANDFGERHQVLAGSAEGQMLFSLQDTGIGLPTDAIDKLFQNFSQADAGTARRYGGPGESIVLDGAVAAVPEPASGALFALGVIALIAPLRRPLRGPAA